MNNTPHPRNGSLAITAVIPTLNEEKYLPHCLDSLLNQTRTPDEILIVDSNSTDNTTQIAKDYGCTLITAPRGKLNARHIGFQKATGDIVLGCDADTTYPPDYIEKMVTPIENGNAVATMGYVQAKGLEGPLRTIFNSTLNTLAHDLHMPGQANAVHKQTYFNTGGFNLTVPQGASTGEGGFMATVQEEEINLPKRLAQHGEVVRVDTVAHTQDRVLQGGSRIGGSIMENVPKTVILALAASTLGLLSSTDSNIGKGVAGAGIGFAAGELGAKIVGQETVIDAYQKTRTGEKTVNLGNTSLHDLINTEAHLHHDMVGLGLLAAGTLFRSPEAAGAGIGLISHHLVTEGASFLGAITHKKDRGKEVKVPIDKDAGVYEIVEL